MISAESCEHLPKMRIRLGRFYRKLNPEREGWTRMRFTDGNGAALDGSVQAQRRRVELDPRQKQLNTARGRLDTRACIFAPDP